MQALRGAAATMVFFDHVAIPFAGLPAKVDWLTLGVDIFFVISGYVMTMLMVDAGSGAKAAYEFIVRRSARLLPLYWLCTTVALINAAAQHDIPPLISIIKSYLLIHDANPLPILFVGWTLIYEFLFYIIISLSILLGLGRWGPILVVLGLTLAGHLAGANGWHNDWLAYYSDPIVLEFAAGGLVAIGFPKLDATLCKVVALIALTIATSLIAATWDGHVYHGSTTWIAAAICVFIAFLSIEPVVDWRRHKWAQTLGDTSYALYLVHVGIVFVGRDMFITRLAMSGFSAGTCSALYVCFCIGALTLISTVSFKYFERPTQVALLRYFLAKRRIAPTYGQG